MSFDNISFALSPLLRYTGVTMNTRLSSIVYLCDFGISLLHWTAGVFVSFWCSIKFCILYFLRWLLFNFGSTWPEVWYVRRAKGKRQHFVQYAIFAFIRAMCWEKISLYIPWEIKGKCLTGFYFFLNIFCFSNYIIKKKVPSYIRTKNAPKTTPSASF